MSDSGPPPGELGRMILPNPKPVTVDAPPPFAASLEKVPLVNLPENPSTNTGVKVAIDSLTLVTFEFDPQTRPIILGSFGTFDSNGMVNYARIRDKAIASLGKQKIRFISSDSSLTDALSQNPCPAEVKGGFKFMSGKYDDGQRFEVAFVWKDGVAYVTKIKFEDIDPEKK